MPDARCLTSYAFLSQYLPVREWQYVDHHHAHASLGFYDSKYARDAPRTKRTPWLFPLTREAMPGPFPLAREAMPGLFPLAREAMPGLFPLTREAMPRLSSSMGPSAARCTPAAARPCRGTRRALRASAARCPPARTSPGSRSAGSTLRSCCRSTAVATTATCGYLKPTARKAPRPAALPAPLGTASTLSTPIAAEYAWRQRVACGHADPAQGKACTVRPLGERARERARVACCAYVRCVRCMKAVRCMPAVRCVPAVRGMPRGFAD